MHINQSIINIFNDCLKPIEIQTIQDWSRKNIILPASYAEPGILNLNKSRYLLEPLNALQDKNTRNIVVYKAPQTGGTMIADIAICYWIANKPGPILFTMKSLDMIRDHVNDRLYPLFQNCKSLENVLPTNDKDFTNTGLKFPNCTFYCNGQAESTFQAKSIKYLVCDEVHLYDRGRLDQALTRTAAFDIKNTSKRLIISQPGSIDDDLDIIYKKGSQENWHVPCEKCGKYFIPDLRQQKKDGSYYGLMWDSNDITKPKNKWNLLEVAKTIKLRCEYCGHDHIDSKQLKERWNKYGKYIALNSNTDGSTRSFRWNSLIRMDWKDIVLEFLQANHLAETATKINLTNFFQQKLARPYNPMKDLVGFIKTDVYDVVSDWPDAVVRIANLDAQKEKFWLNIREWAADGRSRQLFFNEIFLYTDLQDILNKFNIHKDLIFCDYAWHDNSRVVNFINKHEFTGLRGDNKHQRGWDQNWNGMKKLSFVDYPQLIPGGNQYFYNFAPDALRDVLENLRDGKSHEFKCLDNDVYKTQMFSEIRVKKQDQYGNWIYRWELKKGVEDNHAWDLEVMGLAAALITQKVNLIEGYF